MFFSREVSCAQSKQATICNENKELRLSMTITLKSPQKPKKQATLGMPHTKKVAPVASQGVRKQTELEKILPERTNAKHTPKGIPLAKIISLRSRGLSHAEIGKMVGSTASNISQRLNGYDPYALGLREYQKNKVDILDVQSQKILFGITEDDLKKANLQQKATAYGIFHDKAHGAEQKGQAPGIIINIGDIQTQIQQVQQEILELEGKAIPDPVTGSEGDL